MVRTNFDTFSPGDIVVANTSHPYYNRYWLGGQDIYEIDKMLSTAGVVTLKGFPPNQTFPDSVFTLMEKSSETDSSNEGSEI